MVALDHLTLLFLKNRRALRQSRSK